MDTITVTLSKQHLHIINAALAELPYRISAPVLEALRPRESDCRAPVSSNEEQLWPHPQ